MAHEVEFRGIFNRSAKMNPVPGDWYLGFACLSCDRRFAVLEDPNSAGGTVVAGRGGFVVTCPGCGAEHSYPVERMVSFQAANAMPVAPAP